ncbi:hypothetical protein RB595_001620 [Gaeumannomyces hyphopodioides]
MVHSWRLWATAALVLSPLVAATDHTKTVTQTVSDVKTVTETFKDCAKTVTEYKTTVTATATVTESVYVPTTKVEWTTATVPTTATVKTTQTVSKCSIVPTTYMENGQLVRRHDETCVVATVVSTLTISTTYTTKVPTAVQTTVSITTTKPETKTTTTTKATTATVTTTKPLTETAVVVTTQPPVTRVITTTSLSTRTVTTVQPAITVTMTKEGQTVVTTLPAATVTRVEVITLRPETQTLATITVSPAPACPAPTPSGERRVVDTPRNFKWGCAPGYVCNPPKPDGCAVWDSAPPNEFSCEPQHCILAPPVKPVHWAENETGYYPPAEGYFNLDPRAFGLSPGIFEKIEVIKMVDGETQTITTGIWTSQASLSVYPPPTASAIAVHTYKPKKRGAAPVWKPKNQYSGRSFKELVKAAGRGLLKRQEALQPNTPVPARCFQFCNNAFREAQNRGKVPELCANGSAFRSHLDTCLGCTNTQTNTTLGDGGRLYLVQEFVEYLVYCDNAPAVTSAGTNPAGQVLPTGITTGGQETALSTSAPVPIPTSTTSSNLTSSSSSSSTPTSTSTTSGSSASITSLSSSSGSSTNTSTSLPIGTTSRPPGNATTRPPTVPTVPTAGASSWRQPALTTLFLLIATFFAF